MPAELFLGVDGGGTKTSACLVRWAHGVSSVIGRGETGASNPHSAGWEPATSNLRKAIQQAAADVPGLRFSDIHRSAFCIAGTGQPDVRDRLRTWSESILASSRVDVIHDGWALLGAGTDDLIGVAVISGTGSIVVGHDARGNEGRAGGWGHFLGDEGSGHWIGLRALQELARAFDRRRPFTALTRRLQERLGVSSGTELRSWFGRRSNDPGAIAKIASWVLELSQFSDNDGGVILREAATELAHQIDACIAQLPELPPYVPLCLGGGVLLHCRPLWEDGILEAVRCPERFASVQPITDPAYGAARYAAIQDGIILPRMQVQSGTG